MRVSDNKTEVIKQKVKEAFSLDARNWSHLIEPEIYQSGSNDMSAPAKRLNILPDARYTVPINGFLSPIVIVFTLFNNSLVCLVLLKRHMRSPTTIILFALALSDMLTGLFPLPFFIHFYSTERVHEWVPYQWCQAMNFCVQYIPTIFHTASIWLTVALATQRYICVCHVFKAKTWCTTQKTLTTIAFIFLFATLSHSTRFFEVDAVKTTKVSMLDPNITVSACSLKMRPWVKANINLYFNIYFWFRVIFIHLIPCVSLAVMTALLVHTMRMAERRRRELQLQNEQAECRRLRDSNRTTLMLVIVVVTFLLVELPLGLLMVLHILRQTFYLSIIRSDILSILSLLSNFFILLSYPLNFFIYCGMSKQFRTTFKSLISGAETSRGSRVTKV
ncbi:hypothetical protein RRG08_001819 [Elysia crispata]|uniref:G-protein coupled receptors family 1 profile domain-containing protein n=1 Tax=Elysia crispata TaxID=231223 RepID=A0AAE0Y7F1_9GAST|nr:hypothetical protein RRG08_001819 [Elysia crispata]